MTNQNDPNQLECMLGAPGSVRTLRTFRDDEQRKDVLEVLKNRTHIWTPKGYPNISSSVSAHLPLLHVPGNGSERVHDHVPISYSAYKHR